MDTTLEVTPRSGQRKGFTRKCRAKGEVPAVVYGPKHAAEMVSVDPLRLTDLFKATGDRNTVVSLKIGAKKAVPVMVREVQRHPVSRAILHVDFYAVPETPIRVMVPLVPVGRPKGAVVGGRVRVVRRVLPITCRYDRIPKHVEVDVSPLDVGDSLSVSQLTAPEGVTFVFDQDFKVIALDGKARAEAEEAKPAAAAAEGDAKAAAPAAAGAKKA
jgi:large subunit ribosomal protein L25